MKAYQPTRMHLAIVVSVIILQMTAIVYLIYGAKEQPVRNDLVVIDPANTLVMRYAKDVDLAEGLARYDQIIIALEDYHADTGRYPDTLEALVPNYLAQVPAIYFPYGEDLEYDPAPPMGSTAPFLFYVYGHYPGAASMHGWSVKYCPAQFDLCNETSDRHFQPSRINRRWIWVSSSAL
jgi:hypothetical protein